MKLIVLLISTLLFSYSASAEQEVVVLVPGFFNTFAHEYFSNEVVHAFEQRGFKVYVATGLNPIGTVEDNGARLDQYMDRVEQTEHRHVNFNVVAHSAGGLYTLFVANLHKHHVKNLLTIATPYKGVEFLQKWFDNSALFKTVTDLAHLDGLKQLTPQGVAKFLDTVRVAPDMKITAFAGTQKKGLDIWNAANMSVPFRVTSACISEESDGIVGLSSALGVGSIKTTDNRMASQKFNGAYRANLEHWEQVLEGYSFLLLGIRNPGYVIEEQARFYGGLADYLLTSL